MTEKRRGQQRCGIRPLTNPVDGRLFMSESLVALHFSEALARRDLSIKPHPLECAPLTLPGWDTAALCPRISGPSTAHSAPYSAAGLPPDHRLPLRAASRCSRPAAFRAQPAPVRQARPTFSPASIKLPLCPLAGGSCARARCPPTIYTPTCVMCASQSSAPLLGPTGRGKASIDPANEEPKDKGGDGVSRRTRLLSFDPPAAGSGTL